MIAVAYLRRSSKKKDDTQVSIDVQQQAVARYCEEKGFTLARIVVHNGISGTKRKRYDAIQTALDETKAQALVVYNLDRLSRDSAGLSDHLEQWTARGIEVHETELGKLDLRKAINRFTTAVRGALDELYADLIGEKTSDALDNLRADGKRYSNNAPFGYRHNFTGLDSRGKKRFTLVADEEEQRALAIIDRCRVAGMGRVRTLGRLRAEGYIGRASLTLIQKLLEDRNETGPKTVRDPGNGPENPQ